MRLMFDPSALRNGEIFAAWVEGRGMTLVHRLDRTKQLDYDSLSRHLYVFKKGLSGSDDKRDTAAVLDIHSG